jgi:predicted ATP-grasp superfamily ATP-dependent carboligase
MSAHRHDETHPPTHEPARVVVTDGDTRTALAAVRTLGRAGYQVCVVANKSRSLAGESRYAIHHGTVVSPYDDPASFKSALLGHVQGWRANLVLPATDITTDLLLDGTTTHLGAAVVIGPPRHAYDALSHKVHLLERARLIGIPIPRTSVADCASDLEPAGRDVGYPCVVKPHRSVVRDGGRLRQVSVRHASAPDALARIASEYPAGAYPLLVQERIAGHGEGAFFLMASGRILAAFAHRRIREYPVSGGASTYRESVTVPADLRRWGEELLRSAGWSGAAMVEFRRCTTSGIAYLMEVNARLWGSLQLAIDAGVDFPTMLVKLALGDNVEPITGYRTGVRSRWFWGDVDHLIDRLRYSPTELDLSTLPPSRLRLLLSFAAMAPGRDRFEVLDLSDPKPFVLETRRWFAGRITTVLRRFSVPRARSRR